MKLYIKQKVWAITEKFDIYDELGEVVYMVEGSFFSFPKNFKIYDANGNQLAWVENEPFHLLPHYSINTPTHSITLKREFTFFFQRYNLTGTDWILEGDFFGHDYQVISGNHPIMHIYKEWFTWGDSYVLDIENEEDAILCVAIVIAVDETLSKDNN